MVARHSLLLLLLKVNLSSMLNEYASLRLLDMPGYELSVLHAAGSVDSLVTAGVVVEGSGGASIQTLITSIIANGTSSNTFRGATVSFAPTDSNQGAF